MSCAALLVAAPRDIGKAVERSDKPRAHVAPVVGPERHADHLEALAVVALDELGDQISRRVTAEIGREIGHLYSVVAPRRPGRLRTRRHTDLILDPVFGASQEQPRIVEMIQRQKRRNDRCPLDDATMQVVVVACAPSQSHSLAAQSAAAPNAYLCPDLRVRAVS
jgi:hypothetical protein